MDTSNKKTKEKKITLTLSGDEIVILMASLEVDMGDCQQYLDNDDPNCEFKLRIDDCDKLHTRLNKAMNRWLKKN